MEFMLFYIKLFLSLQNRIYFLCIYFPFVTFYGTIYKDTNDRTSTISTL